MATCEVCGNEYDKSIARDRRLGTWCLAEADGLRRQAHHDGRPLSRELVRKLRGAGAAGATSLRAIWGYHGDHEPNGDSFSQLRCRVPVVTVIVDTPERIRAWFAIVDELTDETGLVTSETVPAFRATGPALERGGLRLARRLP
jgi:PII-like signaling protein